MADLPGTLERESAAFANGHRQSSNAHRQHVELSHSVATDVAPSEIDKLLENTLNTINIAEPLTKREAEILQLIVSGKTNKEIAAMLCRTQRTVEYHRNCLMHKLGAHNAAELVKRAIAMGITFS